MKMAAERLAVVGCPSRCACTDVSPEFASSLLGYSDVTLTCSRRSDYGVVDFSKTGDTA